MTVKRSARARGQLMTSDEAVKAKRQHKRPCSDCPWSRKSLPGWVGSATPDEWIQEAHGEARIECHTRDGAQCAGAAIYRANVCKSVRDPSTLELEPDTTRVFSKPSEFVDHHTIGPKHRLGMFLAALSTEEEAGGSVQS